MPKLLWLTTTFGSLTEPLPAIPPMKHNAYPNHLSPLRGAALLLASLGLLALGSVTASAQTYAARVSSTSTTVFDAPCYWIPNGGTAYSTSTGKSGAPGTPTRVGCYFH